MLPEQPLYTIALIHPHFSVTHRIETAEELAIILNASIIDIVDIMPYSYDPHTGEHVVLISSKDPASKTGVTVYRVAGAALTAAMSDIKHYAPKLYPHVAMLAVQEYKDTTPPWRH